MTLGPGDRLGPYAILALVGAGGMGEVYRATDTRLDRTVAIKILPHDLMADETRRQRFEREARAASRLTHPHICAVFDVGEQDGRPFLVMEYLDGESLAARLHRGPLPMRELLICAIEIAGALEHAHRAGLVHRDLKPANIMLTRSGSKLLDFGLARFHLTDARAPADSSAMTMVAADTLTEEGTILGTVPYMAPEQLEERPVDGRTDIFGLGVVLYEMATGRRPFDGSSRASVIAAVLERTPLPVSASRSALPGDANATSLLDQVVGRCLAKNPDDRWQTAADLRHALELVDRSGSQVAISSGPRRTRLRFVWRAAGAAALVAGLAWLGYALISQRAGMSAGRSLRYAVPPPENGAFNPSVASMALSPDGKKLVFVASARQGGMALWLRTEDDVKPRPLPGTEGASQPFWSADSRFVAFGTDLGQFKKIEVATGLSEVLTEGRINVGTWSRDGVIIFRRSDARHLLRISSAGGVPVAATTLDPTRGETVHNSPWFLPDGRHFFFQARSDNAALDGVVYVGSLDSNERIQVCQCRSNAMYADGYLLFVRDYNLVAQPFDLDRFSLTGDPIVVAGQVDYNASGGSRGAFAVSDAGVIAYRMIGETRLFWFDRRGPLQPLGDPGSQGNPTLSPDEQFVAVDRRDRTGRSDIWLIEVNSGAQSRFTSDGGASKPLWGPDGKSILYTTRSGFSIKSATGTGAETRLLDSLNPMSGPSSWASDQRTLVFDAFSSDTGGDVASVSLDSRTPVPVIRTKHFELQGRVSHDGRWLAYVSNESGRYDVYVRPFPDGEGRWLISPAGGSEPAWSHDGRTLFFLAPDRWLMSVSVKTLGASFVRATPERMFETRMNTLANPAATKNQYVVTADGRFLINQPTGEPAPITVVVNWLAELKK